ESRAQATAGCTDNLVIFSQYNPVLGSTYVPVDSWIYPAMARLQALGYADTAYLGMRPWTRLSIINMLKRSADDISSAPEDSQACITFHALEAEVMPDVDRLNGNHAPKARLDSAYTRLLGIAGTPLTDSFHVGQTIVNDYGRPYQEGFNNITGFSTTGEAARFSLYFRGEYQHAPSAGGYSIAVANILANIDGVPYATNPNQATIPLGPIPAVNTFRIVEANLSFLWINHQFSFGKNDRWLGPAKGGAFAWSNNAENIYSFQIDRIEPLRIPLLSRITGPFRYVFFVGSLKGHTYPNSPWDHVEKVSFKPTENLEFGFARSVIWGGQGHVPITTHSFLRSFFSVHNVSQEEKFSRNDPGARFSTFDFTYRLPFLRQWLTLYTDSLAHDDVSPISAPRRAGIRPGIYLSRFPGIPRLDLRVEAASTDPPHSRSNGGGFLYTEAIQKQGYTNKGIIMGDWIGREAKGGQAWLTYHLSPSEQVQLSYRNAKAAKDFIPGGTTQHAFSVNAVKRFGGGFEVNSWGQYERWNIPLLRPGVQSNFSIAAQLTWRPQDR
ncbi:MAG TPA: capsule assembly Wzi family protein, partial [Edaphobacter sp.]